MRIRLLTLAILTSVVSVRAMPQKLPYTEKQFEMAVACIKHFEGWHGVKAWPYVGYGHQVQRGERYSARTLTKRQGDLLLRLDLNCSQYWPTMLGHTASSEQRRFPRADCCARLSEATGTSITTTSLSAAGMADKSSPSSSADKWSTTFSM